MELTFNKARADPVHFPGVPHGHVCSRASVSETSQPFSGLRLSGALPFSVGSLLVYMNLEKIWNGPRDRFSLLQNFANICLAAAVTQTLSFPFDTVKRKMQVRDCVGGGSLRVWGGAASKCLWVGNNTGPEQCQVSGELRTAHTKPANPAPWHFCVTLLSWVFYEASRGGPLSCHRLLHQNSPRPLPAASPARAGPSWPP